MQLEIPMSNVTCPFCGREMVLDSSGNCSMCRHNIVATAKEPHEILEFYCAVCEELFRSLRDSSGHDQAPCPKCGDISNTMEFYGGEIHRHTRETGSFLSIILQILGLILFSGVGWMLLRGMF